MKVPEHLENFLIPVSDDFPCGADFSSIADENYIRIERDIESVKEVREWLTLKKDISSLLEKTKDFRLLGFYASAGVNTEKEPFSSLVDSLFLARSYIQDHWNCVFPLEDLEDPEDQFTDRLNAISELGGWGTIVLPLSKKRSLLSFKGMQDYSLEDLLKFSRGEEVDGKQPLKQFVKALSKDEVGNIDKVLSSAISAYELGKEIKVLVTEKIGESFIEFDKYLFPMLQDVISVLSDLSPNSKSVSDIAESDVKQGISRESTTNNKTGLVALKTRDDVVIAIDMICDYYQHHEPSSPLPLLLKRARGIVYKDFLEVLEELVPDSVSMTESVFGRKEETDEYENN